MVCVVCFVVLCCVDLARVVSCCLVFLRFHERMEQLWRRERLLRSHFYDVPQFSSCFFFSITIILSIYLFVYLSIYISFSTSLSLSPPSFCPLFLPCHYHASFLTFPKNEYTQTDPHGDIHIMETRHKLSYTREKIYTASLPYVCMYVCLYVCM